MLARLVAGMLAGVLTAQGQIPMTLGDAAFLGRRHVATVAVAKDAQLVGVHGIGFHDVGSRNWGSSWFVAASSYSLTKMDLKLGRFTTTSGALQVDMRLSSGSIPYYPTGGNLGTSSSINIATLNNSSWPDAYTLVTVTFSPGIAITSGTKYSIVLETTSFSGLGYSAIFTDATSHTIECSTDGTTWGSYTYSPGALYFQAYGL